eukprot:9229558-Prorocentrum_lima.AAC.1
MTSSLVGSEMCIRDRPLLLPFPFLPLPAASLVGVSKGPGAAPAVAIGPVSYTHLTLPTICSV